MSKVQIYDKPMCCSTGVCGPQVDPVLPRFAADLDWLAGQGHEVQRFNLAQQPAEFASNPMVQSQLESAGVDCLPLVFVDGRLMSRGEYPSRDNLALWAGADQPNRSNSLPVVGGAEGCCGDTGCC